MSRFFLVYNAALVLVAINGVLAFSTYAVLIAGQLSLAQAAFASIAAYSSALLTMNAGWPFPLVVATGVVLGAAAAFLLGLPVLRLRGVYLAIATLGFGEMVRVLALNLEITGGASGLRPIPKVVTLWHAYAALAVCAYFFWRLRGTRLGLALAALRQDEVAASAMGIDVTRYRLFAFTVSGAMAGLSGVLFSHFTRFIAPGQFGFERAVDALMYAIVGGTGHWAGPLLGSSFLTSLPELQRQVGVQAGYLRPLLNGLILLGVILFLPTGLTGIWRRVARRERGGGRDPRRASDMASSEHDPATPGRSNSADAESDALHLSNVSKEFGGVHALHGVNLEIQAGEVVGLIGPNGAGKTTLVNIVTGLAQPSAGQVAVLGTSATKMASHRIALLGVSRTFQHAKLFDDLTLHENVMLGGHRVRTPTFLKRLFFVAGARSAEVFDGTRADRCLETVGLLARSHDRSSSLSYGDRRRLEIARALCSEPNLLVLDEPAAGMNHVEAQGLATLIETIASRGITVLLIEHNVRLVSECCSRVVVLDFGKVIADGIPAAVLRNPDVVRAYLGTAAP